MRQAERRSALPVYVAAAAYAVRALVFPLYRFWHFLSAALITAAIWLVMDRLVSQRRDNTPDPGPEPVSDGEDGARPEQ